ncbi:MAG: hypothetical protein CMO80_02110 [Verrucomicrobiales bacterium]|nr:hypothetical protein [Verrucomicrobiales bacterium]
MPLSEVVEGEFPVAGLRSIGPGEEVGAIARRRLVEETLLSEGAVKSVGSGARRHEDDSRV